MTLPTQLLPIMTPLLLLMTLLLPLMTLLLPLMTTRLLPLMTPLLPLMLRYCHPGEARSFPRNPEGGFYLIYQPNKWRLKKKKAEAATAEEAARQLLQPQAVSGSALSLGRLPACWSTRRYSHGSCYSHGTPMTTCRELFTSTVMYGQVVMAVALQP